MINSLLCIPPAEMFLCCALWFWTNMIKMAPCLLCLLVISLAACLQMLTWWSSNYCDYIHPCCCKVKRTGCQQPLFLPFWDLLCSILWLSLRQSIKTEKDKRETKRKTFQASVAAKWVWIFKIGGGYWALTLIKMTPQHEKMTTGV